MCLVHFWPVPGPLNQLFSEDTDPNFLKNMIFYSFLENSWKNGHLRFLSILISHAQFFENTHSARQQTFRTAQLTWFWGVWMLLTTLISNFVFFWIFNLSKLYHCDSALIAFAQNELVVRDFITKSALFWPNLSRNCHWELCTGGDLIFKFSQKANIIVLPY